MGYRMGCPINYLMGYPYRMGRPMGYPRERPMGCDILSGHLMGCHMAPHGHVHEMPRENDCEGIGS